MTQDLAHSCNIAPRSQKERWHLSRFAFGTRARWDRVPTQPPAGQDHGSATGWDPGPPGAADKCGPNVEGFGAKEKGRTLLASSSFISFPRGSGAGAAPRGISSPAQELLFAAAGAAPCRQRCVDRAARTAAAAAAAGQEWGRGTQVFFEAANHRVALGGCQRSAGVGSSKRWQRQKSGKQKKSSFYGGRVESQEETV